MPKSNIRRPTSKAVVRESFVPGDSPQELEDRSRRQGMADLLSTLGVQTENQAMHEDVLKWNTLCLAPGEYQIPPFSYDHTRVLALAGGVVVPEPFTIDRPVSFVGIRFKGKVSVDSPAVVSFEQCVFDVEHATDPVQLENASGASIVALGCLFAGATAAGDLIANSGAATDIQLVGCRRGVSNNYGVGTTNVGSL